MNKIFEKPFIRSVVWGMIWSMVLGGMGFVISHFTSYNLKNVLFIEGIVAIVLGILSSLGGNPSGLSIEAFGQNNAQYASNVNLEVTRMERAKRHKNVAANIRFSLNMISLIMAGAICIMINFII